MPGLATWVGTLGDGPVSHKPLNSPSAELPKGGKHNPDQIRQVFLQGCGLPMAWRNQAQWRVLETGFGLGLNFLVTWAAWKADPLRPKLLHFVSTEDFPVSVEEMFRGAADHADLRSLALQLQAQVWGLVPGFHRLVFDGGHVLLTLCIGDTRAMLRQQQFEADSVYFNGYGRSDSPDIWNLHTLKAVARCCMRGTRIASWSISRTALDALNQCGFIVCKTPGSPPESEHFQGLQGQYNPSWEPRKPARPVRLPAPLPASRKPSTAVVVGAGLAGAAVANSLARRGWQVMVLDAASAPASGASSLPAGLLAPHVSLDDSVLSQLSRSGVRMILQQADALLEHGRDWHHTGVLTHDADGTHRATTAWPQLSAGVAADAAADWSRRATAAQLADAGLAATSQALWHAPAGWIKPASLVHAWLCTPGIAWCGNARVATLLPGPKGWQVLDAAGAVLAQAGLVVLAAACGSQALAATVSPATLALQAVRGQISWGTYKAKHQAQGHIESQTYDLPDFPVNGHGGLLPAVPGPNGLRWLMGASYERGCDTPDVKPQDNDQNLERLRRLLPRAADLLAGEFHTGNVQAWAGVRCATPGRLPTLGCVATTGLGAEVWICTGMGSRGLTFAGLCAELLASCLHGEPLPIERRLAQALITGVPSASHP